MSFSKLGLPHRIVYASKNFVSGLTDISIKVLKPNGSVHATGIMTEFPDAGFEGIYYFIMSSGSTDPEGEYSVSIVSDTESHKAKTKVTLVADLGGGGSDDVSGIELELDITRPSLELMTSNPKTELALSKATANLFINAKNIELKFPGQELSLALSKPMIQLQVDCS